MFRCSLPYFGSTLLWAHIVQDNHVVWRGNENYQRRSQRNKTNLVSSLGIQTLSIPLQGGKHQSCPIQEVQISNAINWQKQHWHSIETCYGSAPFYLEYKDQIKELFETPTTYLWEWNMKTIQLVIELLSLNVQSEISDQWIKELDCVQIPLKSVDLNSSYPQLFEDRLGFLPNVSILDLILCSGPMSLQYLHNLTIPTL